MWEEWNRKVPLLSRFWLLFVIMLTITNRKREHDYDYDLVAPVTLSTLAYISR